MTTEVVDPTGVQAGEDEEFFDTYSFGGTDRLVLRDGKQWIEFKQMTEGDRAKYERLVNRDLVVNRKTDDARISVDQARDRHALIMTATVGWYLVSRNRQTGAWEPMTFSETMLRNWLQVAPPTVVEDLEQAIRKLNPWLGTENVTVEDIDKQIEELQDQRREVVLREQGKGV